LLLWSKRLSEKYIHHKQKLVSADNEKAASMSIENAPITNHPTGEPAVFLPQSLLKRAAKMAGKEQGMIPRCCVLDFDGELLPVAVERFGAKPCPTWPCFHTSLLTVESVGVQMGLIGGTVGAPFAVLVAEQLIACGCRHIIGYSSAGAIADGLTLPCIVVPNRALRDEGTSYHYLPPSVWIEAQSGFPDIVAKHTATCGLPVHRGDTWTTDAPYRETRTQIEQYRTNGILSVEMEAAALMAIAEVRKAEITSLLHVTNVFGTTENDFDKGPAGISEKIIVCCLEVFAEVLGIRHFESESIPQ
jgi:uridine phosphorylase